MPGEEEAKSPLLPNAAKTSSDKDPCWWVQYTPFYDERKIIVDEDEEAGMFER